MTYDVELARRIRSALSGESSVREVDMFGGLSFVVNEKLAVAASGDAMMLRVDPERIDELLGKGAELAHAGLGRQMSRGWLVVSAGTIATEGEFAYWLRTALEHNRRVTDRCARHRRGQAR